MVHPIPLRRVWRFSSDKNALRCRAARQAAHRVQAVAAVWLAYKAEHRQPDARAVVERLVSEM
jgi:hypothetical protein